MAIFTSSSWQQSWATTLISQHLPDITVRCSPTPAQSSGFSRPQILQHTLNLHSHTLLLGGGGRGLGLPINSSPPHLLGRGRSICVLCVLLCTFCKKKKELESCVTKKKRRLLERHFLSSVSGSRANFFFFKMHSVTAAK